MHSNVFDYVIDFEERVKGMSKKMSLEVFRKKFGLNPWFCSYVLHYYNDNPKHLLFMEE